MTIYSPQETIEYEKNIISVGHFGVNLVTVFDQEFVDPSYELSQNVVDLGATTLRFPGGTATEKYFDMTKPNSTFSQRYPEVSLTPMDQFFAQAGNISVYVSLVIPTREAFGVSAAQSMLDGNYGDRTAISEKYLEEVKEFISTAIENAETNGVAISAFEIGNEFWLSGEMTAYEYGVVAGTVAKMLEQEIAGTPAASSEIVVQSTASASVLFSPRDDATGYVGIENGSLVAFSQKTIDNEYDGVVPDNFQRVVVEGQGSAFDQVSDIARGINLTVGAGDSIDGIVNHYYQRDGFSKVDGGKSFTFEMLTRLEGMLHRSEATQLSYHITEWNTRSKGGEHNRGLQNASMIVENFFELVSNGVDSAQIWPLSFNAAQGLSLVDLDGDDLSISGEMFGLMSESLVGLQPSLDWSIPGAIDIHGFSSDERNVLFVSERSGERQKNVELDIGAFVNPNAFYFMTATQLWDGGAGGANANSEPEIQETDGQVLLGQSIGFDIDSWANLRIEFTYVGNTDDSVSGRGGDDTIKGFAGNDTLEGGLGEDYLFGGSDDDSLDGGAGSDTISGDDGNDILFGGSGADLMFGGSGNDTFWIDDSGDVVHGGIGEDTARLQAGYAVSITVGTWTSIETVVGTHDAEALNAQGMTSAISVFLYDGNDTIWGGIGADTLSGGDGNDVIYSGGGSDSIVGGTGDDRVFIRNGNVTVQGGGGRDTIFGGGEGDSIYGGDDSDWIFGRLGDDAIRGDHGSDFLSGGAGNDDIFGGGGNDTLMAGKGEDRLAGGPGDDILFGNEGSDIFIFEGGLGLDTIADFDALDNAEKIDLSALHRINSFVELGSMIERDPNHSNHVIINLDGANSIVLQDVRYSDLDAMDFIFV